MENIYSEVCLGEDNFRINDSRKLFSPDMPNGIKANNSQQSVELSRTLTWNT